MSPQLCWPGTSVDGLKERQSWREDASIMEVVQCRTFEQGNAWLQEWIQEELSQGESWQRQYEALLERQTGLCSSLQAKSLTSLEQKNRARQKELEESQEALQECRSRRCQHRLHVHKQEKENQRMAESVTELEKKVSKQRRKQESGKDLLEEMRTEGSRLKRHLSTWEAECEAENERIREKQHQLEQRSSTLQELSLRIQELHRNKTLLEDGVMEAQLEADIFQKKAFSGEGRTLILWHEQVPDWMKRFLRQEPETTSFKEQLPSRCLPGRALWTAWRLLWALAKALLLLLFLTVVFHGFGFSGWPCPGPNSAPLLYIQPKVCLPPF